MMRRQTGFVRAPDHNSRKKRLRAGGKCGFGRVTQSDKAIRFARRGRRYLAHHRARQARLPARAIRLRQDHDAAASGRFRRPKCRRNPRWRPADFLAGQHRAARAAQHVDDLPELCALAAYDRGREYHLRPQAPQIAARRHRCKARRHPRHHQARRSGRALPRRIVRRPAATRGAGARTDRRARNLAAR